MEQSGLGLSPSDSEFIGSMARRLSILKRQLLEKGKELAVKDEKIKRLEDKMRIFEMSAVPTNEQIRQLQEKCMALQKQVQDMENFLADYGMVWIGEACEGEEDTDTEAVHPNNRMWMPEASVVEAGNFHADFNLIMKNIGELNVLAGEGIAQVSHMAGGAKLKFPESVPLTVYQNGFLMFSGPFRPYKRVSRRGNVEVFPRHYGWIFSL
eukprot:m.260710 g.260710  ORF g.260710 m.260710 type:complete len:210 (+) comp40438_c1_seq24:245-874(+)